MSGSLRAAEALIDAHDRRRRVATETLRKLVDRLIGDVDPYDARSVDVYTRRVAAFTRTAQQQVANTAATALNRQLQLVGGPVFTPAVQLPARPRGVDPLVVVERPIRDYRRLISEGLSEVDALRRARERAAVIAEADVSLAVREAARQTLLSVQQAWTQVVGYRRVIRPELSRGGTCGLCVAAATRVYSLAMLMPIHDRCNCWVSPVVRDGPDFGSEINAADLKRLYQAAGGTAAAKLSRVRVRIEEHGELGPVLVSGTRNYRDRRDAVVAGAPVPAGGVADTTGNV